jgi:hypothetical protein
MGCGCNKKRKKNQTNSTRKRKIVAGGRKPKIRIKSIVRTKAKKGK